MAHTTETTPRHSITFDSGEITPVDALSPTQTLKEIPDETTQQQIKEIAFRQIEKENTLREDQSSRSHYAIRPYPRLLIDGLVCGGENPRLWSRSFKAIVNAIYCTMILSTTYSSSAYAPAADQVEEEFHVDQITSMLGTSVYVLGFALGPLLFGPASEVVGRKPVYVAAFIALTATQLGACLAQTFPLLVVMRLLSGICGASALNNVASSIVDMTEVRERMKFNIAYRLVSFGGPTLGPLIGTFVTERAGWRWNLRVLPMFSFAILVIYILVVPETYGPTLEYRKVKKAQKACKSSIAEQGYTIELKQAPKRLPLSTRYSTALRRPFLFLFTGMSAR